MKATTQAATPATTRVATDPGNEGLIWNRNLSWEQRESNARERYNNGLLGTLPLPERATPGDALDLDRTQRLPSLPHSGGESSLFSTCMNPDCRTNWLRLWRRRQVPRFEGQWACSSACMEVFVSAAVLRELNSDMPWAPQPRRHRMPLGLILLGQGAITEEQLRQALEAQRTSGKGRIGIWLMRQCGLSEERVTRALAQQWGCPLYQLTAHQPESVATLVPRLFLDSYGMLPLRVAGGKMLYLGFEDRINAAAALAIARMTGLRVETGVVPSTQYLRAHERMMDAAYPRTVLTEAASAQSAIDKITQAVERIRPHAARLVRLHQYLWLRLWRTPVTHSASRSTAQDAPGAPLPVPRIHQVEDWICRYAPADDVIQNNHYQ
jgi:hypothetical protein